MEITEIRVKLTDGRDEKLRAFCSITIDNRFVVRDLKLIEGRKGLFLAMPSRKLADRCPRCGAKNHLQAGYCNECGARLDPGRAPRDGRGRPRLHIDIAHPINSSCREQIQREVVAAFQRACGSPVPCELVPRRPGDVAATVADPSLAGQRLAWRTRRDLDTICRDGWAWQSANPLGYGPRGD